VASYILAYLGGPCNGKVGEDTRSKPLKVVHCGGSAYNLDPLRSDGRFLVYTAEGSRYDGPSAAEVHGRRDVFRAFHYLMRVATHSVAGELRRVQHSRQRIRKAVR
jgi:hypothetical protein